MSAQTATAAGRTSQPIPGVAVRELGDVTLAVISSGVMHGVDPRREEHPEWGGFGADQEWRGGATLTAERTAVFGINWLAVRRPGATVLVDPSSFGPETRSPRYRFTAKIPIGDALRALAIEPADVTHVVLTHGHHDHLNGLLDDDGGLRFSGARHFLRRAEWEALVENGTRAERETMLRHLEPLQMAGRLVLVDDESEVAPGVRLLAAPGETPGHAVVRIDSAAESVFYLGDLVHFPVELRHVDWCAFSGRDRPVLERSRRRILTEAEDRLALYTHAPFPAWGTLTRDPDGGWGLQPVDDRVDPGPPPNDGDAGESSSAADED